MKRCSVAGCDGERYCRGMCAKHYQSSRSDRTAPCSIDGCEAGQYARGWCHKHYQKARQWGDPLADHRQVKGVCSIEGCEKPNHAQDLCPAHYTQWRKYGDPLKTSGRLAPAEVRFWRHVVVTPGCWIWQGAKHSAGYGSFRRQSDENVSAHRFAYELLVGPIPEGLQLDHLCRNPPCVNPTHLEPVTQAENIRRGTSPSARYMRKKDALAG